VRSSGIWSRDGRGVHSFELGKKTDIPKGEANLADVTGGRVTSTGEMRGILTACREVKEFFSYWRRERVKEGEGWAN